VKNQVFFKKMLIFTVIFCFQVLPGDLGVATSSKIQHCLQKAKSYGKSICTTVLSVASSFWENYKEPTWQLTALKICFDYWLLRNYVQPFVFPPTAKEYFKVPVYGLDNNSQAARLMTSILKVDPNIICVIENEKGNRATSKNIFVEKQLIDYLNSSDEEKQYEALGVIAHEQRHIHHEHLKIFGLGGVRILMETTALLCWRKLLFSYFPLIFSSKTEEENIFVKNNDSKSRTFLKTALSLAGIYILLIETLIHFSPGTRNILSEVNEVMKKCLLIFVNRTIGRYVENDADTLMHEDPVILYKLLQGLRDFFKGFKKKLFAKYSSIDRVLIEFLDEHAPCDQRIKVAEFRMKALYDQHESVKNFVNNET
jgi:hypothetical protein